MANLIDAIWTRCYERTSLGGLKPLPWAFLQFGDAGEDRKYVVPTAGATFLGADGTEVTRAVLSEVMPHQPFPLDSGRPARGSGTLDSDKPGPMAVHFFGRI